jgi:uncharacterized membrane protein
MDLTYAVLRLFHIVSGMIWVGIGIFLPLYLMPSLQELGPDAGKVMGALQRRGFLTVLPLIALTTIVTGALLYWRMSGGEIGTFFGTRMGMAFGLGGIAAIVAYLIGITYTRPAMLGVARAMQAMPAASPEEKDRLMKTVQQLRARGATGGKIVAVLILVAAILMALARTA